MLETRFGSAVLAAILGLSLTVTSLVGAEQKKDEKAPPGMVMAKDPVTGKLRPPTPEEQAELARKTSAAKSKATANQPVTSWDPKMIQGPHGAVGMLVDDDSAVYSVATKGADNKISTKEVQGKAAAVKAVQAPGTKTETKPGGSNEK